MNNIDKLEFYEKLTELLNGDVKPKDADVINGENFCDSLQKVITDLFEETHKLDIFSDDFNLHEFLQQNIEYPVARMKEQMEKTWLQDKLTIGLMGHYSTGKTTALNYMFGESFNTDGHENTALATYLTYGNNTDSVILIDRTGQKQQLTVEECKLLDYSKSGVEFPFARIFNYMVKENSNDKLKELTIIDTPGLFSTKSSHSIPTKNAVSSCDAIFWFIDITGSESKNDIIEIPKYAGKLPLYIVLSFVDKVAPSGRENAIKIIIDEIKKKDLNYQGYICLGKRGNMPQTFKDEAEKVLERLTKEHEAYIPAAHIFEVLNFLEGFLVNVKTKLTEMVNELDSNTDKLLSDYKSSSRTFVTEHNNSASRFNNMVNTFNNRCNGATFCGGASGALCNNINSISQSLQNMANAYNNMDESKLVEFGQGLAQMNMCQYKLDKVSEILANVTELKNKLA